MNRRSLLLSLSALTALGVSGAAGLAHAASQILPVSFKVMAGKYLAAQPRVAVGSYPLTFIIGARAKGTFGPGAMGGVDLSVFLDGLTEADFRQMADEALKDLLERFETAGIPTVPPASVLANAEFAALKRTPNNEASGSGKIDSRATKSWVSYSASDAPLFDGQGKMMANEFFLLGKLGKPGKSLEASIVQPRLFIDFTDLNASKPRSLTQGQAKAGGKIEFSIDPLSICNVVTPDKKGLGLFSRLDPTGPVFSPQGGIKGDYLEGVAPPTFGASIFSKARVDALRVDVPAWKDQVRAAFGGYNQAIVDEFRKARA